MSKIKGPAFSNWSTTITSGDGAFANWSHAKIFAEDIEMKGKPLSHFLESIEQRLAILHTNPELEEQWEELKSLGDQYRKLEKEILEKERVWNTIKES